MKEKETSPLLLVLAFPITLIIATFFARIHITILGSPLYIYPFIYPLTYLFSCIILKETDLKSALSMMAIAQVAQSIAFIIGWVILGKMDQLLMIYTFLAVLIEQLILIYTYDFLIKIKKDTYMPLLILLFVVSLINNFLFGAFIEGYILSVSILARLIYAIILPVLIARK